MVSDEPGLRVDACLVQPLQGWVVGGRRRRQERPPTRGPAFASAARATPRRRKPKETPTAGPARHSGQSATIACSPESAATFATSPGTAGAIHGRPAKGRNPAVAVRLSTVPAVRALITRSSRDASVPSSPAATYRLSSSGFDALRPSARRLRGIATTRAKRKPRPSHTDHALLREPRPRHIAKTAKCADVNRGIFLRHQQ